MKKVFIAALEIIGNVYIRILAPFGGMIAGITVAVYTYILFDLSVLFALLFAGIGLICGLIWPSQFSLFAGPFVDLFINEGGGGSESLNETWAESFRSCLSDILMLLYALASLALIPLAIFEPRGLIVTGIIHGVYILVIIYLHRVEIEDNEVN